MLGFLAGLVPADIIKNFGKGFGDVMGSVGIIIGLGTMLGGVLVLSGGADRLATSLTSIGGKSWVPWTTFFVALLIGLPLFFEGRICPASTDCARDRQKSRNANSASRTAATGSATVATITATGLVAQIVERDPTVSRELMVLATGSGSLILSHVNDAGFWLVKEYFGLTVVETFKSWTATVATITAAGRANREAPFNGACPYNPSACFTYLGAGLPKARIVS